MQYCKSLSNYNRLKTRIVQVGNLKIGGDHPIHVRYRFNKMPLSIILKYQSYLYIEKILNLRSVL